MEIGFAIQLNNEAHNYIRLIQLELEEQLAIPVATIVPHITIKSPFETNNKEAFLAYLEILAKEYPPFEIVIDGFGHFTDRVIYLNIADNPRLLDLHWQILTDLKNQFGIGPHEFEGEQIKFHATVSFFKEEEKFELAWKHLQSYHPKIKFLAKTIGVYYYLGKRGYIVGRKIDLK